MVKGFQQEVKDQFDSEVSPDYRKTATVAVVNGEYKQDKAMSLENVRYVKLDLTFGEKIKLLFFGLVDEKDLPVVEKVKEGERVKEVIREIGSSNEVKTPSINNKIEEEKLVIPFFNFDEDIKSNF